MTAVKPSLRRARARKGRNEPPPRLEQGTASVLNMHILSWAQCVETASRGHGWDGILELTVAQHRGIQTLTPVSTFVGLSSVFPCL